VAKDSADEATLTRRFAFMHQRYMSGFGTAGSLASNHQAMPHTMVRAVAILSVGVMSPAVAVSSA